MDESYQSPISCCRNLPPHCLPDQKRLFTQSSSPQSGRNASMPPQPPCKAWDHTIELHPDAKLPRGRTFPLSPAEQKELDKFLRENLANGCICPSKSPIRAPVFFIKKKEGSLCLVQDYWKLNKITIK